MGEMFRSKAMTFCDIFLQPEAAYDILSNLGEMSNVQFIDSNARLSAFQRMYVTEVRRCDEMERKMRFMYSEMGKDKIYIPRNSKIPPAPHPRDMAIYETILEKWESELLEMSENQISMKKRHVDLMEVYYLLAQVGSIIGDVELNRENLLRIYGDGSSAGVLELFSGVIKRDRSYAFETMLWRVSRGNLFFRLAENDELLENTEGEFHRKVAFVILCQGEQLHTRVKKICNGFHANMYPCPKTAEKRESVLYKLYARIIELEEVLKTTKHHRCLALKSVARQWSTWMSSVKKMKAIFHTMNLFNVDVTKKCLIGQCWIPTDDLPLVREALSNGSDNSGSLMPSFLCHARTDEHPPTYYRTNVFTKAFQTLINSYGIATYREVNPALYTIITFPFLFSIMFGDMGHGFIMTLFAAWMVIYEQPLSAKRHSNDMWAIVFGGRYIILLMGLFSMYAGFIYNDVFSKAINIFGSSWKNVYDAKTLEQEHSLTLDPKVAMSDTVYPFGVDPIWVLADNDIVFKNSLKMKWSIIIGVFHMLFGVILSAINYNYFRHRFSIFLEFVPQFAFLCLLFLYLVFLVFFKWITYGATKDPKHAIQCAPSVLILFIDMVLFSTTEPTAPGCPAYMFENQISIQRFFAFIALLCVPIMLFGKPCYIAILHRVKNVEPWLYYNVKVFEKTYNFQYTFFANDYVIYLYIRKLKYMKRRYERKDKSVDRRSHLFDSFKGHSIGDIMVHQAIHTIEYVLSTISHTASYLRLWALSLAHAQLSEMLWHMILTKNALRDHSKLGSVKIYVIFAVWATFTISILVVMEGLSAFLHTLRLHWVEFMSKFYEGLGYPFDPFSFEKLLTQDIEEQ